MTNKQISDIQNSGVWCRITFPNGEIIMKQSMLDYKERHLKRAMKGIKYKIDYDYQITIFDVIKSAIRRYERMFQTYYTKFQWSMSRVKTSGDYYHLESMMYADKLKELKMKLIRLERKIT